MDHAAEYKKANEYSLKCMRVTFIVMAIAWVLNVFHIFIIDQNIMNHAFIGTICFIALGYLVRFAVGFEKVLANYLMLLLFVGMITLANVHMSYHGTLFMLFPMVCSILYNQNRYMTYTFILTCAGFLVSVLGGYMVGLCDANMLILTTSTAANETQRLLTDNFAINSDYFGLVLFYVVPRCMALMGFTSVIKYLKNSIQEKTLREQEILQMAETERMANQAKSHFLAQMSHEIRTPINAVLGMNEMILHKTRDDEILEYAGNIKKAGKSLLVLISSILDFSKIEDGKMELNPVKYHTGEMVDVLRSSVVERAKEKELALIDAVDKNLPSVLYGDDMRLSQVIINLLTNAVKYTNEGSVTLEISEKEREGDQITLLVKVSDTGIGIKEEDLPKLFESFERLEADRNTSIEGTGLGLSITTRLLEMMGSKLEVESTYGKGSSFYFTIVQGIADARPIAKEEEMLEDEEEFVQPAAMYAPDARILVVDDNRMNLKVICNLLGLFKVKPEMVTSGMQAIEKMKENEYDIVFMDHMMPQMDGIETLKKLREEKLIPEHTVVIALTANAIAGAREMYLDASFTDYLTKPIEMEQLREVLKEYLPESSFEDPMDAFFALEEAGEDEIMEFSPVEETAEGSPDEKQSAKNEKMIAEAERLGLETKDGLRFCAQDTDFYREMLSDFAASFAEKGKLLAECRQKEDFKDYQIYVHALKSTSRSIGANALSDMARQLEDAARGGNTDFILAHHEQLLKDYESLCQRISQIL